MSGEDPLKGNTRYQTLGDLGSGSFGTVVAALDKKTNQRVAIKFIGRGSSITRHVERELVNHSVLKHPHVIELREVFLTPKNLGMVMEYATGGTVFDLIAEKGGLAESDARLLFQQLLLGLDYCHRMGIVNRDVKLENTLLMKHPGGGPGLLKICDFGYSKNLGINSAANTLVGSPAYLPPEVMKLGQGASYDGLKSDVWSCGVALYCMLFAAYPFKRPGDDQKKGAMKLFYERMRNQDYDLPADKPISPECQDLLSKMLQPNPETRLTLEQVQRHKWSMFGMPEELLLFNERHIATAQRIHESKVMAMINPILAEARKPLGAVPVSAGNVFDGGSSDDDDDYAGAAKQTAAAAAPAAAAPKRAMPPLAASVLDGGSVSIAESDMAYYMDPSSTGSVKGVDGGGSNASVAMSDSAAEHEAARAAAAVKGGNGGEMDSDASIIPGGILVVGPKAVEEAVPVKSEEDLVYKVDGVSEPQGKEANKSNPRSNPIAAPKPPLETGSAVQARKDGGGCCVIQ